MVFNRFLNTNFFGNLADNFHYTELENCEKTNSTNLILEIALSTNNVKAMCFLG